jgi:hypothetical protein
MSDSFDRTGQRYDDPTQLDATLSEQGPVRSIVVVATLDGLWRQRGNRRIMYLPLLRLTNFITLIVFGEG